MVISITRRSDYLSFFSELLKKVFKKGFIKISNPFNPNQKRIISLKREDVEAIVFWTRNALPSLELLKKLEDKNYPYYIMITFTNYPNKIEKKSIDFPTALRNFKVLSEMITKERLVLRYDPIFFSEWTPFNFHKENFKKIVENFHTYMRRVIVSLYDPYNFIEKRLKLEKINLKEQKEDKIIELLTYFKELTQIFGLEFQTCCERDLSLKSNVKCGSCIDAFLLNNLFSLNIKYEKDKGQRKECLCHKSIDIGTYNTCKRVCIYCYAIRNYKL